MHLVNSFKSEYIFKNTDMKYMLVMHAKIICINSLRLNDPYMGQ